MDLTKYVADIKDFPEEGIIFRDVTPLMQDKDAFKETIDQFVSWANNLEAKVDIVAGPEARGFYLVVRLLTILMPDLFPLENLANYHVRLLMNHMI